MSVENRVAVITGAAGGLGRTAAQALAVQGARLVLLGSKPGRLNDLADELALPADRLMTRETNLREPDAVRAAASAVMERFGRVEILLHLVGGWTGGTKLSELLATDLENMLNQHVWTTFHLIQAFVPQMVANHWGRVIVVSSPLAVSPTAGMSAYAAGKAAEESLLLSLAQEIRSSGVTANILQVRTIDLQHERLSAPSAKNASWTTPEEITAAVLYLCSSAAGQVNGARLPLYGSPA
jgi:NAD(P)-dependent dehydrogenase (short-subunit alcohol dehydrogenase family)